MSDKIVASGKRKNAIARVTLKQGNGNTIVNSKSASDYFPFLSRMRLKTITTLGGKTAEKYDFFTNVKGGGINSQAEACAIAMARALVKKHKKLEKTFLDYDRNLLVADVRRKEVSKPNCQGDSRSKRQKSYR